MEERMYAAIDLKSFYASVECVERGLEPLDANLVVADVSRTDKTICLAVSSALKSFHIPSRARLFEVIAMVNRQNRVRIRDFFEETFQDIISYNAAYEGREHPAFGEVAKSISLKELQEDVHRRIRFLIAEPRMALYVEYSMRIYDIYLKYVSPEDIFAYSIDEVFIDLTPYLQIYKMGPKALVQKMLLDVYTDTGITATAGIGTNLYLSKVAMDIVAKRAKADANGTRVAFLDTYHFRKNLWNHLPLSDFWSIGQATVRRLREHGLYTMGDIARCSMGEERAYYNADLLYRLFGVDAELLIDHAWGMEPVTLREVKAYTPSTKSISAGQVLMEPYPYDLARVIVMEMVEKMAFRLMEKNYITSQIVLGIGYESDKAVHPTDTDGCKGRRAMYRRGSVVIKPPTNLANHLIQKVLDLYDAVSEKTLWIRRINVAATKLEVQTDTGDFKEMDDPLTAYLRESEEPDKSRSRKEEALQKAILSIKSKYGANAVLRGYSFQKGATARSRNRQIGGHKA